MKGLLGAVAAVLAMATPLVVHAAITVDDVALVEDTNGEIMDNAFMPNVYLQKVTCKFYETHGDDYDAVFVFSSIPLDFFSNVQQGWPVLQNYSGIGRTPWNQTASFCSGGRLKQAVKMGDIQILPLDPDAQYQGIGNFALSGIELMGHEFGHHWLASVTFDKGDEEGTHCMLRGYEPTGAQPEPGECDGGKPEDFNQHWSLLFDSRSLMYGSMIEDLGGGQFRLYYENPKFSPLDQYLMGLRMPKDVPPMFVVDPAPSVVASTASLPLVPGTEMTVEGTRVDVTIEDIIRAEGERNPPLSPCHWKAALILVHAADYDENTVAMHRLTVARYGQRWEEFYDYATDQRGSFDVSIDGRGVGTVGCPGDGTVVNPDPGPSPDVQDPGGPDTVATVDAGGTEQIGVDQGGGADFVAKPDGTAPGVDQSTVAPGGCTPGVTDCSRTAVRRCNDSGDGWVVVEDCADYDMVCREGSCTSLSSDGGGCRTAGSLPPGQVPDAAVALGLIAAFVLLARRRRTAPPA